MAPDTLPSYNDGTTSRIDKANTSMKFRTLIALATMVLASPVAAGPAPSATSVVRTDDGYLLGSPKAPIKLVVLSAFGCPHCRVLDATMTGPLERDWIRTGKASLRYVPYGMFPTDLPALFLTECGTTATFFDRSHRVFAAQQRTVTRYSQAPAEAKATLAKGPKTQFAPGLAALSGLLDDAPALGVGKAAYGRCLRDPNILKTISARQKTIEARYKFVGTPSAWIDGNPTGTGSSWPKLEAALRAAAR